MRFLLVPLGFLLLVGGPLLPVLQGGGAGVVALVDLGRDGPDPRVSQEQVDLLVRPPVEVNPLSAGLVELRVRADQRPLLDAALGRLVRPAREAVICAPLTADCADAWLRGQPLFARGAGVLDAPALVQRPAPRLLWLLGMLLGLAGVGVLVVGLTAWRGLSSRWLGVAVGVGALAGAAGGAAAGQFLGGGVQQGMRVDLAVRPRLWVTAAHPSALEPARDAAARLVSPGFLAGLPVRVKAIPDGNGVILHVNAPGVAELEAYASRVQTHLVAREQREAQGFRDALQRAAQVVPGAAGLGVGMPAFTREEMEPDGRGPGSGGLAGALAGALLAWAACVRRR